MRLECYMPLDEPYACLTSPNRDSSLKTEDQAALVRQPYVTARMHERIMLLKTKGLRC